MVGCTTFDRHAHAGSTSTYRYLHAERMTGIVLYEYDKTQYIVRVRQDTHCPRGAFFYSHQTVTLSTMWAPAPRACRQRTHTKAVFQAMFQRPRLLPFSPYHTPHTRGRLRDYKGMLPCFFSGFFWTLFSSASRSMQMRACGHSHGQRAPSATRETRDATRAHIARIGQAHAEGTLALARHARPHHSQTKRQQARTPASADAAGEMVAGPCAAGWGQADGRSILQGGGEQGQPHAPGCRSV